MRNKIFTILLLLFSGIVFGQDLKDDQKVFSGKERLFSFSPIHSNVSKVNGLVIGAGHYENEQIDHQTINGLNIDVIHPAPLIFMTFGLDIPFRAVALGITPLDGTDIHVVDDIDISKRNLTMNGLNLSVGGFYQGTDFNGLNISLFTVINRLNGFSIAPVINASGIANGIQISALANVVEHGNGCQMAISNVSEKFYGIQIGLFNKSFTHRGFQIGLWNKNGRRSLPFFNWQFSDKKNKKV